MGDTLRGRDVDLIVIVGPTAVGKTALSIRLAQLFWGEVISADSRQIYRGMDIGTAKATAAERAAVPHHLLDVVDPDEDLTLAHYQRLAVAVIEEVWRRGKLPLLVGGTGLYVHAVTEGWTIPEVPPNPDLRERLAEEADRLGYRVLHDRLAAVDPAAAARIDGRNVRRVIRALEVHHQTGAPISALQRKEAPGYRMLKLGLTMAREELYRRIDERVDRMMADGLLDEVRALVSRGYSDRLPSMSGLGYRQMAQYLRGEVTLEEAVLLIKRHTRRFVRQQYNWFRLEDPEIHWLDMTRDPEGVLLAWVRDFLARCPQRGGDSQGVS